MSASDRAYAFAKERILDGRFAGGELLSEGAVATGAGVSRTPVREAFLRLEIEGLLRLYPKRGALVVAASAAEIEAVMETRLLIERFAVEKAVAIDTDLGPALEDALANQERMAEEQRFGEFVEADHQFHRAFVAAAVNPILLQVYDSLRDRQRRMGLTVIGRDEERVQAIMDEHRRLMQALVARDRRAAIAILAEHLESTRNLLQDGARTAPTV